MFKNHFHTCLIWTFYFKALMFKHTCISLLCLHSSFDDTYLNTQKHRFAVQQLTSNFEHDTREKIRKMANDSKTYLRDKLPKVMWFHICLFYCCWRGVEGIATWLLFNALLKGRFVPHGSHEPLCQLMNVVYFICLNLMIVDVTRLTEGSFHSLDSTCKW